MLEPATTNELTSRISRTVRALREARHLSRREVVKAAGISERYLIQVEAAEANATAVVLDRIARALGVTLKDLLDDVPATSLSTGVNTDLATICTSMSQAEQKEAALVINEWLGKRRRSRRGVAILGLRGAGKSTIGRLFAERHGLSFVSVTREIESRTGLPLNDLFNLGGADAYRAMETETILSLAAKSGFTVLETAGGIVANREALDAVLSTYRSVWLKASAEEHLERVISQGDMRPIKDAQRALEHVRNLLDQRNAEYVQAEFMLDTTGRSPMECVKELERMLGYLSESPEE
jgi:XRE family aerobic/anaerobic benzoate catabolism transcriptional regulator